MNTVRWNIAVSPDVDQSVRMFIAAQGGGRKGDLSRFIEEAVREKVYDLSAAEAKAANRDVGAQDMAAIIDEALIWARTS